MLSTSELMTSTQLCFQINLKKQFLSHRTLKSKQQSLSEWYATRRKIIKYTRDLNARYNIASRGNQALLNF